MINVFQSWLSCRENFADISNNDEIEIQHKFKCHI